ncbi:MAG: peptidase dimerization domain-containing protein, partial [Candidatus Hodarchaeota archaeon]
IRSENEILIEKLNLLNPKIRIIKEDNNLVDKKYENANEILLSEKGLKIAVGSKLWDDFISTGWTSELIGQKFASISFNPDNFLSGSEESQTIVPDEAISEVDIRIPPKVAPTQIIEILKQITSQFPYITMEIIMPASSDIIKYFQGAFTSPTNPFIQNFYQTCNYIYDQPRIFMPFSSGTSDDRFIEVLGLPHVKFGATGQNNHSYNEWVDLSSFFRVIQVYSLMMADLDSEI